MITNYDICRHLRETKGRLRLKNRTYFNHVYTRGVFSCFHPVLLDVSLSEREVFVSFSLYLRSRIKAEQISSILFERLFNSITFAVGAKTGNGSRSHYTMAPRGLGFLYLSQRYLPNERYSSET